MRIQAFVRAAAGVLVAASVCGVAFAEGAQPPKVLSDVAPLPPGDRMSSGAVILMDQPVLAQRGAMTAMQERTAVDTRAMGAGPSRALRNEVRRAEKRQQDEQDTLDKVHGGTPQ